MTDCRPLLVMMEARSAAEAEMEVEVDVATVVEAVKSWDAAAALPSAADPKCRIEEGFGNVKTGIVGDDIVGDDVVWDGGGLRYRPCR